MQQDQIPSKTIKRTLYPIDIRNNFVVLLQQIVSQNKKQFTTIELFQCKNPKTLFQGLLNEKNQINKAKLLFFIIIRHCELMNVMELDLTNCKLLNGEFLRYLAAPLLKKLILQGNYLTVLKPIQTADLPVLAQLNIGTNNLLQICGLDRMKVNKGFEKLVLAEKSHRQPLGEILNWIFKLEVGYFDNLRIKESTRIKQLKVNEILKKKFCQCSQNKLQYYSVTLN